ncbi:Sodium-coupled monocarboxylate transporter 1 [Armadillidium vulgare]|nr:Sodium-coupled monocarboxylate transporter 1 [Armadillidium vulgare]
MIFFSDYLLNNGAGANLKSMNPSLYERHNFYNTIAFGAFYYGSLFSISQINVQRISSVKTLKDGKMVLIYTMIGFFILHILIFSGGIVVYASYEGCDPVLEGKIKSYNQLLSFFIMNKLNIIGFAGIFSATLLASTLRNDIVHALLSINAVTKKREALKGFKINFLTVMSFTSPTLEGDKSYLQ